MARRPVFIVQPQSATLVKNILVDFTWHAGFSVQQKRRSIESLHEEFHKMGFSEEVLEVSSASPDVIGRSLSAFRMKIDDKSTVESIFQGSKVFENGGPYTDLYLRSSKEAKKDSRIHNSGKLIGFFLDGRMWPLNPKTYFYDWIYLNALNKHVELREKIVIYDAFTDIEFNPKKSINCQAYSAALYVSLYRRGILEESLSSPENFKKVYTSE